MLYTKFEGARMTGTSPYQRLVIFTVTEFLLEKYYWEPDAEHWPENSFLEL